MLSCVIPIISVALKFPPSSVLVSLMQSTEIHPLLRYISKRANGRCTQKHSPVSTGQFDCPKSNAPSPCPKSASLMTVCSYTTPTKMNWARDDAELSIADLGTVFKYDPKESTVVRMLSSQGVRLGLRTNVSLHAHKTVESRNIFTQRCKTME